MTERTPEMSDEYTIEIQQNHRWQRCTGFMGSPDVYKWGWIVREPDPGYNTTQKRWSGSAWTRRGAVREARRRIRIETTPDHPITKVDP